MQTQQQSSFSVNSSERASANWNSLDKTQTWIKELCDFIRFFLLKVLEKKTFLSIDVSIIE